MATDKQSMDAAMRLLIVDFMDINNSTPEEIKDHLNEWANLYKIEQAIEEMGR